MKVWHFVIIIYLISCSQKESEYDLIVSNVNLIDGTGTAMQEGVNVYVIKGRIEKIDSEAIAQSENVIDGTGKYLIPGLIDCHIHTTNYKEDFAKHMHYGVTGVFIPGGSLCTNEYFAEMRAIGNQDSIPSPRVFHTSQHFTLEGRHPVKTYTSNNWREGLSVFFLRDTAQIAELVREVAQYPIQGIKLTIEDGPHPPFLERMPQEFIDKVVIEAAKYDLEVFAHASDLTEFLMAVKGGVQNIIHFLSINLDWENEEHVEAVNALLERDGSIVTTLMIDKHFIYPLYPEWLEEPALLEAYPLDSSLAMITPQQLGRARRMYEVIREDLGVDTITLENLTIPQCEDIQELLNRGINVAAGTDAAGGFNFHGYSMHEELQLLEYGGIAQNDIIKMATLNAAKMVDAQDSLGTIEPGKLADFVLLDANPLESISNTLMINEVFKNGKTQRRIERQ